MKIYLLLTLSLVSLGSVHADSLYPIATDPTAAGALAVDAKAHKVGDIMTVVIAEAANGTTTAGTTTSKNDSATFAPGTGLFSHFNGLGLTGGNTTAATGTTSRTDTLSATIAVTIKAVYPNGTMLIEGTRSVGTNNDVQLMTLTGVIRQQDIAPDNSIQSPQVADAQIKYSGKGPVAQQQHSGIITRLFKVLF